MGFILPTYNLRFTGAYEGLEVHMRGLSAGRLLDLSELMGRFASARETETLAAVGPMIDMVASALIGWNVQQGQADGEVDVPADRDGVASLNVDVLMAIVQRWAEAAKGVDAPLGAEPPGLSQVPMEPLPS